MRKLILKCGLAPGDIVMLTAAVRDLHYWYPHQFATDVRTACPDIWLNNPYLTRLHEDDPHVQIIECDYPLIDQANHAPYHCLHGFIHFLNERLHLSIKPTFFRGDIHLSPQEKAWYSQVHELTAQPIPFWIIDAGGKYDVPIKWWDPARYQEVVNHFRGKIQFVQVGQAGHHHPRLLDVIDLRGQTTLRELIRLVHHAQGVLCPVTALMHLAAATPTRQDQPPTRPCVVIAGAREPAHWEAYPGHQFIHTNAAVPCAGEGGCWKDRVHPLNDGDHRDHRDHLCVNVVGHLPRCMDLISSMVVIDRIETFFRGGALSYLNPQQSRAAQRGVSATACSIFDQQPLNIHSAGLALQRFINHMPGRRSHYQGRGIVICGGGIRYFTCAWVCINMLRRLGCQLPIQLWHLGKDEIDGTMQKLVAPLRVTCVDASAIRKKAPVRFLAGWELKPYALLHSPFREVLLLDADNVPVRNPEFLFDTPEYQKTGAMFWPDFHHANKPKKKAIWRSCRLRIPAEPEFETGQLLLDKHRHWEPLRLTLWFNENSDFYFRYLHGEKETFHLAFKKLRHRYSLIQTAIYPLKNTMCQHDPQGRRLFQHRNNDKWDLLLHNSRIKGFRFEQECRNYISQLRRLWDGRANTVKLAQPRRYFPIHRGKALAIQAVLISVPGRNHLRERTLKNLVATDWPGNTVDIDLDSLDQQSLHSTHRAFRAFARNFLGIADYLLFLSDDLMFNQYLWHNLERWKPLASKGIHVASVHNPQIRELACDAKNNARLAHPHSVHESLAFLVSPKALQEPLVRRPTSHARPLTSFSLLAATLNEPVFYHAPSLVQQPSRSQLITSLLPQTTDFNPHWKA